MIVDFKGLAYIVRMAHAEWTGDDGETYVTQAIDIYSIRSERIRTYAECPSPHCGRLHHMPRIVE